MSGPMADAERIDFGILLGLAYGAFVDELHAAWRRRASATSGARTATSSARWRRASATPPSSPRGCGITSQGAAKLVDEMVARGYVERHPHAADGRVKLLALAPRGQGALAAARRFHAAYEERLGRRSAPTRARAAARPGEAGRRRGLPGGLDARLRPG